MITLKNLLLNTPIADESKNKLLADLPTMNSQHKLDLEMLCWQTLAQVNELLFEKEKARIMLEVDEGKRQFNANDFSEAKVRLYHELAQKLEHAGTQEQIDEVRLKLEEHIKNLKKSN